MFDMSGHMRMARVVGVVSTAEQHPVMRRSRTMMSFPVNEMTTVSTSVTPPNSRFANSTVVYCDGVAMLR